jgi:heme exporter protein B
MTITAPSKDSTVPVPQTQAHAVVMRTGGGIRAYLRKIRAIAAKDLRAEVRAKEVLGTMIAFSVLAVIVFGLAFDLRVPEAEMVAPGVLWVVLLFTGVLGLNRAFGAEVDRGSLSALLLAPVDRSSIYFGKLIAQLVFMLSMEILIIPLMLVVFDVSLFDPWILLGVVLGTIGYVSVGVLFAALTSSSRARETMLPILLLPVMVPVFVAGVGLTSNILDGREFADFGRWLLILTVYDLVFLTIAYIVFDLIWEGT